MTDGPTLTDWKAATYDRIADPQARWGSIVLDRLPLGGGERVLDAGCGSGRVTEQLLERLPDGHVVALDASASMLVEARRRLARFGDRVTFVHADLARPLPIAEPVDAILSTAALHWVSDHDAVFANLASVLRPGGRLAAQCGGAGNIAGVIQAIAEVVGTEPGDFTFATPDETRRRLEAAGFEEIETWLNDEPTTFEPGEPFETYLETVILGPTLGRLAPARRPGLAAEVARRMTGPVIDYVRLNIVARRADR